MKVAQLLINYLFRFDSITIVTGSSYPYINELNEFLNDHTGSFVHLHALNETEMSELFNDTEYAIVPSSGVLQEALACRCKVISGYYTEHQKKPYLSYLSENLIVGVDDFSSDKITFGLNSLNFSSSRNVFDKNIPTRMIDLFNQL